jgi:uncharacterized protein YbcI
MSKEQKTKEPQKKQEQENNNVRRMAGKTEKAIMKKGNRSAIVDTTDRSHSPYYHTLIQGQEQWQLVHQDRYKLVKRVNKVGNIPMSSLRMK